MSRGHIRQRGKSWQALASGGFDPVTKKRVMHTATARTREDAERELTRLLRNLDTGTSTDPGKLTLGRYLFDQWLPHQATRVKGRTHYRYGQLMRVHVLPSLGNVKMAKLRPSHIQSALDKMDTAPRTKVQTYRVLSAALRQAVKWQILSINPASAASPPRPGRPQLHVPSPEGVGVLLGASEEWFEVALALLATTGMRRGEALALQWQSVDLDAGHARIIQAIEAVGQELSFGLPKTDRARRTVSLPPGTVALLRRWKKDQLERRMLLGGDWKATDLVVERGDGKPIHPDVFSRRFQRLTVRLGMVGIRLHDLRHWYATELLKAGVHPKVVSEALGHSSVAFTMDVYSHLLPTMQEQASAAIEALGVVKVLSEAPLAT
jgi:integrase